MNRANRIKLGAFLLISMVLLVGSFLAVGVLHIFQPTFKAVTVLDTSIEGLSVGSPVKYLGLTIGRVTRVAMRKSDGYIVIYFDIFRSSIESAQDESSYWGDDFSLDEMIKQHNLSCFINAAGVMGGTYLELGNSKTQLPSLPNLKFTPPEDCIYIPSQPSHIGSAIQNISRLLEEVSKLNLVQMSDKVNQALDNVSAMFTQADLVTTMKNLNLISKDLSRASDNLQKIFSDENIKRVENTLSNVENSSRSLEKAVSDSRLAETIAHLDDFLKDASKFLASVDQNAGKFSGELLELKASLTETLANIDNSMHQLQRFSNNLEDAPEQFVRGREKEAVLE